MKPRYRLTGASELHYYFHDVSDYLLPSVVIAKVDFWSGYQP